MTEPTPTPPAQLVAFFRADPWVAIRRILAIGPTALCLGALIVFFSLLTHMSLASRESAAALGFVLVAGGALFTIVSMHRLLREELCLTVRTDGLLVQVATSETYIAWDALARARWDPERSAVVLERIACHSLVLTQPYAGIAGPALAVLIERSRQRAALGFLR